MKFKHLLTLALMCVGVGNLWAEDQTIFTEDFEDETYNVSWGGTSAGGIAPAVTDGVLTVANGSQSGDRGAYVSFGTNAYEGSAHLKFDMAMTKSGWSGKNNTFYVYPTEEKNRYPSRTDALVTISQDANGAISVNGNPLGSYSGTSLTYDLYLDSQYGTVKLVVLNGETEINTFNLSTSAKGIGAFHLTFNKNYGAYAIDNISLSTWTPDVTPTHCYTVNAMAGSTLLKQLTTGITTEGSDYKVEALSYALMHEGNCYVLSDDDVVNYSKTFTMGTEDQTSVVEYAKSDDVLYFFEAESILSKSYGNSNGNYSGGVTAGVYSGANLTMSDIAAGTYVVTVNTSVRRSNEDIFNVEYSTDGETWEAAGTITLTSNVGGDYSAAVSLPADGAIRLVEAKGQNFCHYVDYVILTKPATVTMAVSTAGWATFVAPFEVEIPEGVTAYTVDGVATNGASLEMTEVKTAIPANTPVVLEGSLDATTVSGAATAVMAPTFGLLTGVYSEMPAPVGSYVLQNYNNKVGFYQVAEGAQPTVGANRAYLTVPTGENARFFGLGGETAINAINAMTSGKAQIFDLNGRQLNSLQKGINIVNGVKILVK